MLATLIALAAGMGLASAPPARAAIGFLITVDSTSDAIDPGGGHCSLRGAIIASNTDTTQGGCVGGPSNDANGIQFALSSSAVINVTTPLPAITQQTFIDGSVGNPSRIRIHGPGTDTGLLVEADGSTIRGLKVDNFDTGIYVTGQDVTVAGNVIGPNVSYGIKSAAQNVLIGGTNTAPASGCSGDCNRIVNNGSMGLYLSSNGTVQGNFIGTNAAGTSAAPNHLGIVVSSGTWLIGGANAGLRNLVSGNTNNGLELHGCTCTIEGNFIGTTLSGNAALHNGAAGIAAYELKGTIGGTLSGTGNVISGNGGPGIYGVYGQPTNTVAVEGNLIGTKLNGGALGNGGDGIYLGTDGFNEYASNWTIGLVSPAAAANVIAYNTGFGVSVAGTQTHNDTIRGNSIHDNNSGGIKLDLGANAGIPQPTITASSPMHGTACANCTVDIYSDAANQGRTYQGSVTADGTGNWTFSGAVAGPFVTATATDPQGNTSAFSAAVSLQPWRPDGRISKGSGSYVGNNVYNTTGANQTKAANAARGTTVTFRISIQNDGATDSFRVLGAAPSVSGYTVKFFHGTIDVTAAVEAGVFTTATLPKTGTYLITAKVVVGNAAAVSSHVTGLVTVTSVGDSSKQDAVKFVVGRS